MTKRMLVRRDPYTFADHIAAWLMGCNLFMGDTRDGMWRWEWM